jgi:hypothetical protein
MQIGSSTGRAVVDNCDIAAKVPEIYNGALTNPSPFTAATFQLADSCHKVESWQTQVRGFAAYTVPKIDVLVSSIMRFQPNALFGVGAVPEGNSTGLSALYTDPVATGGRQVNLLEPGQVYGDRINQIDMRFGKIVNLRQQTSQYRHRLAEPLQREHGDGISAELRGRNTVPAAAAGPESEVRAVQRHGRLLGSRGG